jgi:hypothetical protein
LSNRPGLPLRLHVHAFVALIVYLFVHAACVKARVSNR